MFALTPPTGERQLDRNLHRERRGVLLHFPRNLLPCIEAERSTRDRGHDDRDRCVRTELSCTHLPPHPVIAAMIAVTIAVTTDAMIAKVAVHTGALCCAIETSEATRYSSRGSSSRGGANPNLEPIGPRRYAGQDAMHTRPDMPL